MKKNSAATYARQRQELENLWRRRERELNEYGVQGMKWGVRKPALNLRKIGKGGREMGYPAWQGAYLKVYAKAWNNRAKAKTALGKARLQTAADALSKVFSGKNPKIRFPRKPGPKRSKVTASDIYGPRGTWSAD